MIMGSRDCLEHILIPIPIIGNRRFYEKKE